MDQQALPLVEKPAVLEFLKTERGGQETLGSEQRTPPKDLYPLPVWVVSIAINSLKVGQRGFLQTSAISNCTKGLNQGAVDGDKVLHDRRQLIMRRVHVACLAIFLLFGRSSISAQSVTFGPLVSHRGMVASSHPLASEVGVSILKKGGNAFDAAVAVAIALGVLESNSSSGITGEGFGLFYVAKLGELKAIDWGSQVAVSPEFAKRVQEIRDSQSPVNLIAPGALAGLAEVLEELGTMTLSQVLVPAIEFAEQGVVVREPFQSAIEGRAEVFRQDPASPFLINGKAPPVGSILSFPDLAGTLRLIAAEGKDVLYEGAIAKEILAFSREVGGLLSKKDLELASEPAWVKPLSTTYRGYRIHAVPPAAGGIPLIEVMNILEGFNLRDMSEVERTHVLAEAFKLAFIDMETYFGDPKVPTGPYLSKEVAAKRRAKIQTDSTLPWNISSSQSGSEGTTHFVVADSQSNVAAVTNTRSSWGLARPVGRAGIFLHAGTRLLSTNPNHPMFAKPGKRLQKSMTPVMVFDQDGKLILALGAAGGRTITHTNAQLLVNVLDLGLNVQEAITAPRVSYARAGDRLRISYGFSDETVEGLGAPGPRYQEARVRERPSYRH